MSRTIIWCRDHPVFVVVGILVISLFFLFQLFTNSELDASIDGMIIRNNEDYAKYEKTKREFVTDNISVVYIKDDNIFSSRTLADIEQAFFLLEDIPGVVRIDSLFNVRSFNGTSGTLEINPLIHYIPREDEQDDLLKIRINAIHSPLLLKNLVSEDGSVTVINILVENTGNEKNFNRRVARDIEIAIKRLEGKVDKVFQIGTPYRRDLISKSILGDLSTLIPLALVVILITLAIILRNLNGAFIPILTGGLSILWTLGFMAQAGISVNILTAIVPPMLLALGCTEDIHIISEYFEGLEKGLSRVDAIGFLAPQIGKAIVLTGITTFFGCLSIIFNDIGLLKQFGMAASFGIAANFVITVSLVPVYLRCFGSQKVPQTRATRGIMYQVLPNLLCNIVLNHKKPVLIITGLVVVVFTLGIPGMKIDNNLIGYFRSDAPIRHRSQELHQKVAGSEIFYLVLTAKQPGAFKQPDHLSMVLDIQNHITSECGFDFSLSLADHVAFIERENNFGKEEHYVIPESSDIVAQHLLLFHNHDLDRYVNHTYDKANIIVRHNVSSSFGLKAALAKLERYIQENYSDKVSFLFTGENILLLRAADTMAMGLAKSLSFMFLFIFILISFLFRDIKLGLISLIPNALPIAMIFGVMGHFDIPLNTGTTMIAVISIGVAVDDTVHLMTRFKQAAGASVPLDTVIRTVVNAEIKPVFASSVALTVGFFVLSRSHFLPVAYFGVLSGFVIIIAFFADLIITPIAITFVYPVKPDTKPVN